MEIIEHPIVFYLLGIPVRDTVVYTWLVMAIIIIGVILIEKIKPNLLSTLLDAIIGIIGSVLDEDNLNPYIPLLGSLMVFIFFSSAASIIPGVKSPTSDINTTIALALIVFFAVHYYGIRKKGFIGYLKEFATPIFLFPLEIISQFSRTISLALRLFGNVLGGDLIFAIVFSIIPMFIPVAVAGLGLFTGILQAYVFTILASLYIGSAVAIHEEESSKKESKKQIKEKRKELANERS